MEILDYFLYYPMEDILVIYTFENDTLREDSFYGFEYGCESLDQSKNFWDIDWDEIETIRHRVLLSDYTEKEYIEKFGKNENFHSLNYEEKYSIKDILEVIYENEFD